MALLRLVFLLGVLTALFLAVGFFFGGVLGMTVGLVLAFVMNFVSYWYSDSFVLKLYRAKEIKQSDYAKLRGFSTLAKNAELPKTPKLYIINTDITNAFATGRSKSRAAVAVTKGLLEKLDKDEIEGVLAHELAHVKNHDTLVQTMAATMAGALSWLAYMFYFGDNRERSMWSFVFLFVLVPLAATLIRLAISRNREFYADRIGALIAKNPLGLASALEKIAADVHAKPIRGNSATSHLFIVNPFTAGNLISLFSTHPPTEERVARLKAMKI